MTDVHGGKMLILSADPETAERQLVGLIFYLTTFGYVDGQFDSSERAFIQKYIRRLLEHRARATMPDASEAERAHSIQAHEKRFNDVLEHIDRKIQGHWNEVIAKGERQIDYVMARLKLHCFEIFKSFDRDGRRELLDTVDELLMADGVAHPEELKFREELADILAEELLIEVAERTSPRGRQVKLLPEASLPHDEREHDQLAEIEQLFSVEPATLEHQVAMERELVLQVRQQLDLQRTAGDGLLQGHQSVSDFDQQQRFLDRFVHLVSPAPGQAYELTVIGDLHGCYSCFKAALMQSRFLDRFEAWERDPTSVAEPALVLLGDYVDRGLHSFHGVLRGAMKTFTRAPRNVFLLRGNHEHYIEAQGEVFPTVHPADALLDAKKRLPAELLVDYANLFDSLPGTLLFGPLLFVHAGIPKQQGIADSYADLGSLNEAGLRYEMMWGDPSAVDAVPDALQEPTSRFAYGRRQCQQFLRRIGCRALFRGHERLREGFRSVYDDDDCRVLSLFSAGGRTNPDLPRRSNYRHVRPMAATVRYQDGRTEITPWVIDYEAYATPELNGFYRRPK